MAHLKIRAAGAAAVIVLLFSATWFAYTPGLSGTFLFDDFVNLPALGDYGPVDNWRTFVFYLTSGNADPTGRPLSLLSFLLDAQNWPADAEPFKRTNILLHGLNGVLLCWLLVELGRALGYSEKRSTKAALLAAAIWLLHPLWISTTLYIVQREAMLPAGFVMVGLIGYSRARRLGETAPWIVAWLSIFTTFAFLSKANGLLLPVLALVIECIVRCLPTTRYLQKAPATVVALMGAVTVVVTVYLVIVATQALTHDISGARPWTEWQRIITEPRVVCDYLALLVFPHPYSRGLFNDSFPPSVSFLEPWTTLPAMILLTVLILSAVTSRKRYPACALAILFYFVGHVMESTTVPLELYFEHRNYLPALLLFWPIALWLTDSRTSFHRLRPILAVGVIALLFTETRIAAALWGDPNTQAIVWAAQNPDSPRAQAYAANVERGLGRLPQAEARLRKALETRPLEIQLTINLLGVKCDQGSVPHEDLETAKRSLRDGNNLGPLSFDWISHAISLSRDKSCTGLTFTDIAELIDAQRSNRRARENPRFRQDLLNLDAELALASHDTERAARSFMDALRIDPRPDVALRQAAMLGGAGLPGTGLEELDYYTQVAHTSDGEAVRSMQTLHRRLLNRDGFWTREVDHLRGVLQDDLKSQRATSK